MSIWLLPHHNLSSFTALLLFDHYFTSKEHRPFPLQFIFEHKWAFISMILNLFLVTDLWEFDTIYEPLLQNVHTHQHLHEVLRSMLSTLPSQGHLCTPDYELLIFYVTVIDYLFYFYDNLYGRYCYPRDTAEETGTHQVVSLGFESMSYLP